MKRKLLFLIMIPYLILRILDISCEAVKDIDLTHSSLVCGYSQYFSANNLYDYYMIAANFDESKSFGMSKLFAELSYFSEYKVKRINSTFIRFLISSNSYEVSVSYKSGLKNFVTEYTPEKTNHFLLSYASSNNLFYYNKK